MIQLIYVSKATQRPTEERLVEMLQHFRTNNKRALVTGLLLYDGRGTYIQALEGEEPTVTALFDKIKQDSRHERVNLLGKHPIYQRDFPEWQMGFKRLSDYKDKAIPGLSDFLEQNPEDKTSLVSGSFALDLLDYFKCRLDGEQTETS